VQSGFEIRSPAEIGFPRNNWAPVRTNQHGLVREYLVDASIERSS
jgi:hypothetical protein